MQLQSMLLALAEPVPPKFISKRKQAGQCILYIAWHDLISLLQQRAGIDGFSWAITDTKQVGERFVMTGRLTIYGEDGSRSMDATGQEVLNCSSYGDPSSNAEAMALRRACAKFGLGLVLWQKEEAQALLKAMSQPLADWTRWTSREEGLHWASKELDLPEAKIKALWEEAGKPLMTTGEWSKVVARIKEAKTAVNGNGENMVAITENPFG